MRRIAVAWIVLMLLAGTVFGPGFFAQPVFADEASQDEQVSLILTSDMQAHVQPDTWTKDGETTSRGGFAAVKTLFDQILKEWPDSIILDGGGFSMGTPYQTIEQDKASVLTLMGMMGYDVTTLGDHEFNYRPVGLASMLNNASKGGARTAAKRVTDAKTNKTKVTTEEGWQMPAVVGTNIDWEATLAEESLSEEAAGLKNAFDRYGVQDYIIIRRGGIRVAVFGLMGYAAIGQSPESGLIWQDPIDYAKHVVSEIERNGEADMIVCLSHSGINDPAGEGREAEDIELAKQVPGIDVILSGHTHTTLEEPITVGTTTIVATGSNTQAVGHLVLNRTDDGYTVASFELLPADGSVKADEAIQKAADAYKKTITEAYFSKYGYEYDEVLAANETAFTPIGELGVLPGEEPLCDLIADAYDYAVRQAEGDADPVDVTIVPRSTISASLGEGPVTAADVYDVLSYGVGPDGLPGYPLISYYLTGKELKTLADIDISVAQDDPSARLYFKGLTYSYNTHRMIYNRTMDHQLAVAGGEPVKLENKKLYRVVSDLDTARLIKEAAAGSRGMLSFVPKDREGHVIIEFDRCIVPAGTEDGGEIKAWYALASYIDSFEGDVIPTAYHELQGRKIDRTGFSPVQLLKQPNRFTAALLVLILLPVTLIVLLIILLRKRAHVQRGYKRSMFGSAAFRPNGGKPVFKGRRINRKKLHKWTGRY